MTDRFNPLAQPAPAAARPAMPSADTAGSQDIEWTALFGLIRRRLPSILVMTMLLGAAVVPLVMLMPQNYVAQTRLILSEPGYGPSGPEPRAALNLDTELERMGARTTLAEAAATLDLARFPELDPARRSLRTQALDWLRFVIGGRPAPAAAVADVQQRVLDAILSRLDLRRDGASGIIVLSFRAEDPQRAAQVANQIVQSYVASRNRLRQDQLATAIAWLTPRISEQQGRHRAAQDQARRFQSDYRLTATPTASPDGQAVADLALRRSQLEQVQSTLTATLTMIPQTAARPLMPLTDEPAALTALRTRLQAQQQDLQDNQAQFGADYGGAALARERIERTHDQLLREAEIFGASVRTRLQATQDSLSAVAAQLQQAQGGLSRQNLAELQLADLLRSVEAEAATLSALQRQRRELQALQEIPALDLEILSPATPPTAPEGHGRKVTLAVALLVVAAAAVMIAGLRELMDRTLRSHDQIRQMPGAVPVGLVPAPDRRQRRDLIRLAGLDPGSAHAQAIATMIAMIQAASRGVLPASLLVCPAGDAADATLLTSGLALGLVADGKRVLIVDCHEGRPRPGRPQGPDVELAAPANPCVIGLSDSSALRPCSFVQEIRWILNRAALTDSTVIFDAPAVLASATTLQLTGLVGRTVLAARWGVTSRKLVALAVDRLAVSSDGPVLVAIEGVNLRRHARSRFGDALSAEQQMRAAGRTFPVQA